MSEFKGTIVTGVAIAIIVALGLGGAVVAFSPSTFQSNTTSTLAEGSGSSTSSQVPQPTNIATTSSSAATCIVPGQPIGAFIGVLSDSGSAPIVGASVTLTESLVSSNCGNPTGTESTVTQIVYAFTTNSTQWYSLNVLNAAAYQITVAYSGHTYNFNMSLGRSVFTCGTIHLPSGTFNATTSIPSGSYNPASGQTACQ